MLYKITESTKVESLDAIVNMQTAASCTLLCGNWNVNNHPVYMLWDGIDTVIEDLSLEQYYLQLLAGYNSQGYMPQQTRVMKLGSIAVGINCV